MAKKNKQLEIKRAERAVRLDKLQKMRLNGVASPTEMAAALGVSVATIYNYLEIIDKGWGRTEDEQKEMATQRNLSDRQLLHLLHLTLTDYEISRKQEVETTVTVKEEKCHVCRGMGIKPKTENEWCETCDGVGTLKMEVVTQKQIGKAGDPVHLEVARKCIVDRCKLLGLYLEPKDRAKEKEGDKHIHYHEGEKTLFAGASPNAIIAAMSALKRIEEESKQNAVLEEKGESDNDQQGERL